jgi:hypothetical protein
MLTAENAEKGEEHSLTSIAGADMLRRFWGNA